MVSSAAATVEDYFAELPADRREVVQQVADLVRQHIPDGYEEGMQFGMICWYVPLAVYPDTYNGAPLGVVALAAQKRHYSLYLHSIYCDEATANWFEEAYRETGKRMDVGKSCVRFRRLDDLPLEVVGQAIGRVGVDDYIDIYERARGALRR